jgi:hypothetical protein
LPKPRKAAAPTLPTANADRDEAPGRAAGIPAPEASGGE